MIAATWVLILQVCTSGFCDGRSITSGFPSKARCESVGREQMRHPDKVDTGSVRITNMRVIDFRCVPASEIR